MGNLLRRATLAALVAAIINVVVFLVAVQISGTLVVTMPDPMDVSIVQPFIFTMLLGILGSVAAGAIALRSAQPRRTWVIIAIVAIVLYGVPPFLSAGVTTAIWFNVMHAVAGICVIPAIARVLPETR
ncbi:MAG: DUF6069 family protein [Roseiflexaceae bacterium]|jgi:hypothetical protein|nr:DUF6069 family protein [Chloroflexaceae bacterium]